MLELFALFGILIVGILMVKVVFGILGFVLHLVLWPIKLALGLVFAVLALPFLILLIPVFVVLGLGFAAVGTTLALIFGFFCAF